MGRGLRWLGRTWDEAVDGVLRQRARTVFSRGGLFGHLPLTGRMLEVGGGTGHGGEAVLRRMPSRQCVVADPAQVPPRRLARRMRTRDFAAVRAAADALPFADARFDAAWASFALQHLPPAAQERAAAEMHRVVRPGGTLILVEDVLPKEGRSPMLASARHFRLAAEWRQVLGRHGWDVREEMAVTWLFPPARLHRLPQRAFVARRSPLSPATP